MTTHAVRLMFHHKFQRLIAEGKLGVHAHHAGQHIRRILLSVTNPSFIFQDRLPRLIEPSRSDTS